jgi:hypothetical protein
MPSHAVGLSQVRSPAIVNVGGKIAVETIGMRPGKTRAAFAAAAQSWGAGLCMRSQPSIPNFAGSRPNARLILRS